MVKLLNNDGIYFPKENNYLSINIERRLHINVRDFGISIPGIDMQMIDMLKSQQNQLNKKQKTRCFSYSLYQAKLKDILHDKAI